MLNRSCNFAFATARGISLLELLVATFIGAILLTGLVQIAADARSSFRLQNGMAELQESGRFAIDTLGDILRRSAFTPEPWSGNPGEVGLTAETADEISPHGDRLGIRTWSERNCFGNPNPVTDGAGLPRFFLKDTVLELNGSNNLIQTCRYGPATGQFVTQLNRQGMMQNVDDFQVLYAEDVDNDGMADWWVPGGHWQNKRHVLGLQLAVLLSTSESVIEPLARTHNLLNKVVITPADGRIRHVFTYTQALRVRAP